MAEDEKAPYIEKSDVDRKRREQEMNEFEDKGYFTMPDGSKSYEATSKNDPVRETAQTRGKKQMQSFGEPEEAKLE